MALTDFRSMSRSWSKLLLALLGASLLVLWWVGGGGAPAPVEPVAEVVAEAEPLSAATASSAVPRGRAELPIEPQAQPDPGPHHRPPAPPEEEVEEYTWPDPVQTGSCTLALSLVDAETWKPVSSTVDLWRLAAPGNERWTRGDQLQVTVAMPEQGAVIRELPAGEYRVRCYQEAEREEDPVAFTVEGGWTDQVLPIRLPRSHPVHLRVYDEHGDELRHAEISDDNMEIWKTVGKPAWRQARQPTDPSGVEFEIEEWSSFGWASSEGWAAIEAGPEGFLLGEPSEESRDATARYRYRLRFPRRNGVMVAWEGGPDQPWRFEAAALPRELLQQQLAPSDGSPIAEVQEAIVYEAEAVRAEAEPPGAVWHQVPVRVQLNSHPRYADFEARFRWKERPWPVHRLLLRSEG